jgi:hypothetical protein
MHRLVAVLFLTATVSACRTVGGAPANSAEPAFESGTFGGVLTVDGTEMEGFLSLTQIDGRFQASFRSEGFGFEAQGEGRLRGERLEIVLSYEMDCRGELRMRGTFLPSTLGWKGELVASDCTGEAAGTFRFVNSGR